MPKLVRMTLMADPERTCKDRWHFILSHDGNGDYRIEEMEISGDRGCQGHPQTIAALVKGRRVSELDLEALADTPCARGQSCGQTFAKLLADLKRSLDADR